MFEPVTTNAAAILTLILLWSALTGMIVYAVLKTRHEKVVNFLDTYIEISDRQWKEMQDRYGHLIDNYQEHMLDDVLQEDEFGASLMAAFESVQRMKGSTDE